MPTPREHRMVDPFPGTSSVTGPHDPRESVASAEQRALAELTERRDLAKAAATVAVATVMEGGN